MGMYSTFNNQDIEVKNPKALKKLKAELGDDYNLIDEKTGEVDFQEWCGHKIEGYWYSGTVEILKALAPYLEGYAEFQYEEGWNFRILFEDGKVYTQRQKPEWHDKQPL